MVLTRKMASDEKKKPIKKKSKEKISKQHEIVSKLKSVSVVLVRENYDAMSNGKSELLLFLEFDSNK